MRPRCHLPECLPDDVHKDGVVWRSLEEVRDDIAKRRRPLHPAVVEKMWAKWRAAQDLIVRDWLAAQTARVAEIALVIDRDKQRELFEREETARREYLAADHAENAKWAAAVTAAQHLANKKEMKRLRKDIARDQATIREAIKRRFRPETRIKLPGIL